MTDKDDIERKAVTRTVTVSDLEPHELASIFAAYDDDQQAAFFDAVADEVKDWGGTGWCGQCSWFVPKLKADGKVPQDIRQQIREMFSV